MKNKWQIQKQMYVAGYQSGNLAVMNPTDKGERVVEFGFVRDDVMVSRLVKAETEFYYDYMINNAEPPLMDLDIPERDDHFWITAAEKYRKAFEDLSEAEMQVNLCKKELIDLAKEQSCRGGGLTATKYTRKGNIDYLKIPELIGVDTDVYRKAPSESWRLTLS